MYHCFAVDTTWDDPVTNNNVDNCEVYPYREDYKYFLIALSGVSGDHHGYSDIVGRSAVRRLPSIRGVPDGWY